MKYTIVGDTIVDEQGNRYGNFSKSASIEGTLALLNQYGGAASPPRLSVPPAADAPPPFRDRWPNNLKAHAEASRE